MAGSRADTILVGRGQELRAVHRVLRESRHTGRGATISVSGPAGIGKSALLRTVVDQADEAGFAVRQVQADRLSQRQPLSVISELFDQPIQVLRADDENIDHGTARSFDTTPLGLSETAAILGHVEKAAVEPLLLVVDDIHWADRWSLLLMQRIARISHDRPLVMLLGARDLADLDRPEVSSVFTRGSMTQISHLELAPIGLPAVLELARQILTAEPGPTLRHLLDRAGGNPLLITELLSGLKIQSGPRTGYVDVEPGPLPTQITGAVRLRLGALADNQRILLQRAAVLGMSFSGEDVASVMGCSVLDLAPDLLALSRAGLLTDDGHRYSFAHDLTHEVIYAQNSPSIRRALHRDVADVLAKHGASPVRVLYHLAAGAEQGDEWVVGQLLAAAQDLAVTDPSMALSLLDRAGEIAQAPESQKRVEYARAAPLAWAGQLDEASDLLRQSIAATADAETRAELRWTFAGVLLLANRTTDAIDEIRLAASETCRPVTLARLAAEQALAELAAADSAATETALRALQLGEACGDATSLVAARSVLALQLTAQHDYEGGLQHTDAAVALAEDDVTGEAHRFTPWFYHGVILLDVEDGAGVAAAVRTGRQRVHDVGNHWADAFYCGLAASLAFREGRLDEATAEALAGIALGADTGVLTPVGWCHSIEAHIAIYRGDLASAAEHVAQAQTLFASGRASFGIDFGFRAEALLHEVSGDTASALTCLCDAWHGFEAFRIQNCQPLLGPDLVRLAARAGDEATVTHVLGRLAESATTVGAPASFDAISERSRGLASSDAALLAAAYDRYPPGRVLDRALTGLELVECLSAAGNHAEASRIAGPLRDTFASMEAEALQARLESVPGFSPAPSTPLEGIGSWNGLTNAEQAVSGLVARGATNAEIAHERGTSIRTVETQLYRTYMKLGVSSRTQLALEAAKQLDTGDRLRT